jgi:hypothetical protein
VCCGEITAREGPHRKVTSEEALSLGGILLSADFAKGGKTDRFELFGICWSIPIKRSKGKVHQECRDRSGLIEVAPELKNRVNIEITLESRCSCRPKIFIYSDNKIIYTKKITRK